MKSSTFLTIIIGVLIVAFVLSRCGGCGDSQKATSDTVVITKVDTVFNTINKEIPTYSLITKFVDRATKTRVDSFYIDDPDVEVVRTRYKELAEKYAANYTYNDSIPIDTFGHVYLKDVISENQIKARSPKVSVRIPEITKTTTTTITTTLPPKRQVYLGGEITGGPGIGINGLNAMLMYKDRNDRAFFIKAGGLHVYDRIVPMGGVGMLWKIKL